MTHRPTSLANALLVIWFAAIVGAQFVSRRHRHRLGRAGILLPEWRFFAPNPAVDDYWIEVFQAVRAVPDQLSRVEVASTPLGDWANWSSVFAPETRMLKMFRDVADAMIMSDRNGQAELPDWLVASSPYLTCLSIASRLGTPGEMVQFEIVAVENSRRTTLFRSRWHLVA